MKSSFFDHKLLENQKSLEKKHGIVSVWEHIRVFGYYRLASDEIWWGLAGTVELPNSSIAQLLTCRIDEWRARCRAKPSAECPPKLRTPCACHPPWRGFSEARVAAEACVVKATVG